MIAIVDYGVGNLRSVGQAFTHLGVDVIATDDASVLLRADGVVLPGVGAFGDAMNQLRVRELITPIKQYAAEGKPLLGICLGMQMLFDTSEEHGEHAGLGLISGSIKRMQGTHKIPHVGWNQLEKSREHPLVKDIKMGDSVYFVHSYYAIPDHQQVVVASVDYYQEIPAIVVQDQVIGMQFHPEKSSTVGLQLLSNFIAFIDRGERGEEHDCITGHRLI
ncbi:imidazole glycerol phosphate synthase subunit HisH [Sulfoacidibacillus ferrooxidans]|uniref:Imidazole glycerol phosphate synthase subunit HisH n=1 Tax=Sulfoacidibacillus ferrooxidans TaxID=2005001 RepID=A0A9X1V737_9BACL|nr:imidazole glycerol phosphate synthase subunit HisH [Sulfoacidibacillus ferrooxidans]MCI0182736.1 Imidazole glycerol phosphate synthase subunit HisH [Sulfoacidibacillus ferrooxidans]